MAAAPWPPERPSGTDQELAHSLLGRPHSGDLSAPGLLVSSQQLQGWAYLLHFRQLPWPPLIETFTVKEALSRSRLSLFWLPIDKHIGHFYSMTHS
jgi:hypothetical protein